ncbi:MAG: LPS export ABC transporter periplasmic protein LptC [Synechococcus sp.]|nr:LPS export ABC transporter periplasmic protein LptC [Synechococcus sp.]
MARLFFVAPVLAIVSAGVVGCTQQSGSSQEPAPPFVFRSLDLNQRRKDGQKDWDLKSPEARYELSSRTVRARQPKGILYRNDRPFYEISAELATVLNDGELVVLEGSVKLQQLKDQNVLIKGDRLVWSPQAARMMIDQRPEALDAESRLISTSVTFLQNTNTLRFRGPTQLLQWKGRRRYGVKPESDIRAADGQWNLDNGDLNVQGPVLASQPAERQLRATALKGNTRSRHLDLLQPVQLKLGKDKTVIKAGLTRWDYGRQRLTSTVPFQAISPTAEATGDGFVVDQPTTTMIISRACRLKQPGEALTAQRCSWNWRSERLIADGDVVLTRSDPEQVTRAARLEGLLGEKQGMRFTAGGQPVQSTLRFKPEKDPTKPSSSRSPVQF